MGKETPQGIRVFLVDDHPAMRQGLCLLLTQVGHVVCGEAASRAEFLARLDEARPEIALVDLSLAEESGLDLLGALLARDIPALIYSMHEDCATIERAFSRGAQGYVTKREVADVLLAALGEVVAGARYASPRVLRSLANRVMTGGEVRVAALSQREEQILDMLGSGETNTEISRSLGISSHTVQTYCARIMEKFGLDGMKALRKLAIRRHK